MNYLFVNTAEGTRVLLGAGENSFYDENLKNAGSETLLPMIDSILSRAGIKITDIDVFGVCVGPGSFTGLRIGLTTVKTFCYVLGKPCFSVNNLRLAAYNNKSRKVISLADAGNKVCYVACFDGDEQTLETKCVTLADAEALVKAHADHAVVTDGKLFGKFDGASSVIGEAQMKTAAEAAISTASSQSDIVPLYVRKAQPERGVGDL